MSVLQQSDLEDLQTARELLLIRELESRGYVVRRKEDTYPIMWSRALNLNEEIPDKLFRDEAMASMRRQLTEDMVEFKDRPIDPKNGFGRMTLIKSATIRLLMPISV